MQQMLQKPPSFVKKKNSNSPVPLHHLPLEREKALLWAARPDIIQNMQNIHEKNPVLIEDLIYESRQWEIRRIITRC